MKNVYGTWYVTWDEVEEFINELEEFIKNNKLFFTGVYGIPRGGCVLATLLSYRLNIPMLLAPYDNCLIIDDIADSGRTLAHFTSNDTQFNKYFIATMYYHNRSIVKPNFYKYNKDDLWIVFPWEEKYV